MTDRNQPSWEKIERAWRRPQVRDVDPTLPPSRFLVKHPVRLATAIAAVEGLSVAASIICGDRGTWSEALGYAVSFGLTFALFGTFWLWSFLRWWNEMEGDPNSGRSLLLGVGLVPMGAFRVGFSLLIATITIWSVVQAGAHGLPERGW